MSAEITRTEAAGLALLHRPGPDTALPLVLLHGIGSNAESWLPLMGALPADRALWAWYAPGYGTSAPVAPAAPRPDDYAAVLERLLDTLGLDRILLAGHSLGCLFSARFATRNPARVERLALMSPALGYGVTAGPLPPGVQARIDDLNALGPQDFAARRAARLVYDAPRRPAVLEGVRRAMAAVNPAGYAQAVHALGAGDLLADAARLTMPVLVATGLEDLVTPPDNARRLHAALPNPIRLAEFSAAGHAMPQEFPAEIAALLGETILV
ncbi:alpha/beta fold hydrolase [Pararoseomonas indoligenes]|uniref:Alpha/beta fold hydrolase n=1 Tax=Roseomonas indoligenes TaxID=2820811 RepID=A0A940N127_9PROT|nr:alpha/beta fold hydrolase [Pararoseomonas indoligenes]MBP0494589.1 alpha/beta fold hydrolase [Pararoseomonas indoligenes]